MPPPVYSRVAIRIGFGRLPPACAREGKDHGDTDAHCARYQETRPAGGGAGAPRRRHFPRGDRLDSPAAEVLTAPATHAPPWSCPRRLLPHWEHRSMPLRGRTRISSTGSEHSGESVIRTSSATMPLTFGNPANKLLLRRSSRFISLAGKQNTREHPSRSRNQRLDDELTSTKTAIAPNMPNPDKY